MRCPSCGTELEASARFCGACGHRLATGEVAPRKVSLPSLGNSPIAGLFSDNAEDPYIDTTLNNRFHVEEKLGEGGFGAVYRGTQTGIGRKVALKLLHPEMTRDDNLIARFRQEGLVMCNLKDAHTITTYDFDQTPEGILYIAMELLEGRSLHDVFAEESPIEWQRMFRIVSQMCTSLAEAHEQRVVHRDLKPENIHLEHRPGNPEFVKILDFGIAKVVHGDGTASNAPQLTATGQTLGTLEYMSPEQLMGKPLDGRSDIYAVGVVSYELITGRLPFPDARGPAGLITAQLRKVPEPPSVAYPPGNIPPAVDACILKMLEKDKNSRYADANDLRVAVEQILQSGAQPAQAYTTPPPAVVSTPAPGSVVAPQAREASAPVVAASAEQNAKPKPMGIPGRDNGPSTRSALLASQGSRLWLWLALAIVVVGAAVGAALALK